jgi:Flp pilus assembly protein TadG
MANPNPSEAILDVLRTGAEFFLHTTNNTQRIFLFLRDNVSNVHSGNSSSSTTSLGSLVWSINGVENEQQKFPLNTLTEITQGKHSEAFRENIEASRAEESCCFTLISPYAELSLTALSEQSKTQWWEGLLYKLTNVGKPSNNSAEGEVSSPSENHSVENVVDPSSPSSLRGLLQRGTKFRKYEQDLATGAVTDCEIILYTEGVGRSGSLYWVEIDNSQQPKPNNLPLDNRLPLANITDFMLRKKSPPLKQSAAPEECCFALVTDKYTLNLEAANKETCKLWKEGLILMLTTAGKQVVRADGGNSSNSVASKDIAPQQSHNSIAPAALQRNSIEEKEVSTLKEGQVFTLYYANTKGQQEVAKVNIFFVELSGPETPGALYWCSAGAKKQLEGQRLLLNTLKQMVAGREQTSFKNALAAANSPSDQCFSIVGKSLVLNLEAPSHGVREQWMKGLHGIMVKYQQYVQEKKKAAQQTAAAAAAHAIAAVDAQQQQQQPNSAKTPPHQSSAAAAAVAAPVTNPVKPVLNAAANPSNNLNSVSATVDENIRFLREGQQFNLYTQSGSSGDFSIQAVFVYFTEAESSGPGTLNWCDINKRELVPNQSFKLATITRMVAGKETAPFQTPAAAKVPIDRCLSIIGKQATLNLEAPSFETRELWMKSLHQIMLKYGKKAHPSTAALTPQSALTPSSHNNINSNGSNNLNSNNNINSMNGSSTPSLSPPTPISSALAASGYSSSAFNPLQELEAQYLAAGHNFKLFYINSSTQQPAISEITIYFEPLTGSEYPGALLWQPANQLLRVPIEGQKMLLNKIQQMAGGKDTPLLKSPIASASPRDRCLYLNTAAVSLNLEAASPELKNTWMKNLHQLMIKLGRQTIDENKKNAKAPVTPTSSNGSGSQNGKSSHTMDAKTALNIVQAGATFTMYYPNDQGVESSKQQFFYFMTATGNEVPGILFWCDVGQRVQLPKQRFTLNTIKQMRAGKETPILKSAVASKAKPTNCLSVFSSNLVLNLEAATQEVRDSWMKSLHTVLVRYGMKAVEDSPNNGSHNNSLVSANNFNSESLQLGAARPLSDSPSNPHINRTINFMDPTEFFSIQAKIGEGSYGAVYKAVDHRDGKAVAIKVIPFSGKDSLKLRKEIRVLKQCNCPFIVGYKGAFHKNDNVWIVMEYCASGSLSDVMQICKRTLSEQQVASVMRMCLAGLAYLHGQGKIHRDIKGGNILVDGNCICKLADFGVSGNLDKTLGKHRTVIGTPHW